MFRWEPLPSPGKVPLVNWNTAVTKKNTAFICKKTALRLALLKRMPFLYLNLLKPSGNFTYHQV
jgi:hypothetical protein